MNSSRGNKYYDTSAPGNPGYSFPAYSEAPLCATDADSWQPRPSERGDIARAMFYLVTRYTGDATNEPALMLTDNPALITIAGMPPELTLNWVATNQSARLQFTTNFATG